MRSNENLKLANDFSPCFIELNPNPIIELNKKEGVVYLNLSARIQFASIGHEGVSHPILTGVIDKITAMPETCSELILLMREIEYHKTIYEQQIFSVPGSDAIYIYMSNITTYKQANEDDFSKKMKALEEEYNEKVDLLNAELKSFHKILCRNRDQFNLALKSADAGTWNWNIPRNVLVWDEPMGALLGLKFKKHMVSFDNAINLVHPDDREKVTKNLKKCLNTSENYTDHFRIIQPDGTLRFLSAKGKIYAGKSGQPLGMAGICLETMRGN